MNLTRTWWITGCSSGFGAALARTCLAAGDRVFATARNLAALGEIATQPNATVRELDVTDGTQVRAALEEAFSAGRVDVIVNNAGGGLLGALEDVSDEEIDRCMRVNFSGPLNVMRCAAPRLRAQGGGWVVNISAAAAIANYPGFSIYGAAKAALEFATESFRAEMAPHGVAVTLVQPGPFRTQFVARSLARSVSSSMAHEATVGKFSAVLGKMDGRQPGDPARAAAAILRMVQAGRSPLRLVLGAYAIKKARDTANARLKEIESDLDLSSGTEFGVG
jgi:NAD(P)-dependent dehydrogenase (short-subunit alcohol dehydrogenase family)